MVRPVQDALIPGDHRLLPDGPQGAFQGEQIAHPVVDDGDHPSPPSKRMSTARAWAVRPSSRAKRLTFR